ncbi:hypothetical protein LCGC14_2306920 [marine sediment metagenome]|uniref:Uncharacterized protein n=1 Tax=marine sediment metagenome TaxID=412755 RepID=A0A0F9D9C3_9ZZZZ
MTVAQDDVLKATWQANVSSPQTIVQAVFWYKVVGFVGGTEEEIGDEVIARILLMMQDIQLDFTTSYDANLIKVVNQSKKEFVGDDNPAFVGTGSAVDGNPAQVAVQVLARGVQLGHTGRKYHGPVADSSLDNGQLQAASLTRFQAFALKYEDQFVGGVSLNTYAPGTAQIGVGGVVQGFRQFEAGRSFVQETCRTQRRRTPGRGLG